MFDGIVLGQYIPGESFLHRLNPITKIVFCLFFMIVFLFIEDIFQLLTLFAFVIICFFISSLPLLHVLKGLKTIIFFLLITFVMHLFFSKEGVVLFEYSFIVITSKGLYNAILIFLRIFSIIMLNSILTLTTMPTDIAWAIEKLLYPLRLFRFPVEDFALMLSLSLRFIPVLFEELNKIIDSQRSRGAMFDSPSFVKKIMAFPPILIPLFVNSFQRAEEIAIAMETRCYSGSKRTHLNIIRPGLIDVLFFITFVSVALISFYLF
ncbi:MAG: transporter [Candidatus Muiribacterium halophilum]|uniref:Transporter n=1 Tax=Muiribacterium halophilum TaxID=2053465 RepID=A0A2N5Z9H2_MUIH1|nr:MAG: transporter [Candidatus Muirbacterium halophilum]